MIEETDVGIAMSDGVSVAVRLWRPDGSAPVPTLFAASPYRYDNDDLPTTSLFLWRETGPIRWYVEHGYAYVHLDVRGTGKSGGSYGFFDRRERRDLFEVIEWIAAQPWSNGRVGGIGHSYYATSQWYMAAERPPHLACIAPYDGHVDPCSGWVATGGIPGTFISEWWNNNVRPINRYPANASTSRELSLDLAYIVAEHPVRDDFWDDRTIVNELDDVTIPVLSVGVWCKRDLHLAGNIIGYQRVRGERRLRVSGAPNMSAALKEFDSEAFHEREFLPFYERHLKGRPAAETDGAEPAVVVAVGGSSKTLAFDSWPPATARHQAWYLDATPSGSVTSLNDGSLLRERRDGAGSTSYRYPDPEWTLGPVVFGPFGFDPIRRVLTFTSAPLPAALTVAGHPELVLYLASDRNDTDVIVKLAEQRDGADHGPPSATLVTKGWLRASHRASQLDESVGSPIMLRREPLPLAPGEVTVLRVPLMALAHRFAPGSRIRLEIANADSPLTDAVFTHEYRPDKVGVDTIYHDAARPSCLLLPVIGPVEEAA